VPVTFDATGNRRAFRERARQQIRHFLETYVDCPLSTCMARDPKGIYRQAQAGRTATVPGLQSACAYEPPQTPDLVVDSESETPEAAARRVLAPLIEKGYIR
jgi:adenylylsulfate kinase-like enzyme